MNSAETAAGTQVETPDLKVDLHYSRDMRGDVSFELSGVVLEDLEQQH